MNPIIALPFKRFLLSALMVSWLLAGCASLVSYSVSEAELERYLMDSMEEFDRRQLAMGAPLALDLERADITLGPEGRNVMVLDVAGNMALNAFGSRMPAQIALRLEGTPVYEPEDKAVYIRRLTLLDSDVQADWLPGGLAPMIDLAARLASQVLEQVPVYRLDEDDQRRLRGHDIAIDVKSGRLVLRPVL